MQGIESPQTRLRGYLQIYKNAEKENMGGGSVSSNNTAVESRSCLAFSPTKEAIPAKPITPGLMKAAKKSRWFSFNKSNAAEETERDSALSRSKAEIEKSPATTDASSQQSAK